MADVGTGERKTTESEGGRPAGALAQARADLDKREKERDALVAEATQWRLKLAAATTDEERKSIKEATTACEGQQKSVGEEIEKLRDRIERLEGTSGRMPPQQTAHVRELLDRLRRPATPLAVQPPVLALAGPSRFPGIFYEGSCANELAKAVYNCGRGSAVLAAFKGGATKTWHGVEWDYLVELPGDSSLDTQTFASCLRRTNDKSPEAVDDELSSPPMSQNPSPQRGAVQNAAVVFEFSTDPGKWKEKLGQLERRLQILQEEKMPVLLAGLGFPEVKFKAICDRVKTTDPKTAVPVLPRCLELHNTGRLCLLYCTRTYPQEMVSMSRSSASQLKDLTAKLDALTELMSVVLLGGASSS